MAVSDAGTGFGLGFMGRCVRHGEKLVAAASCASCCRDAILGTGETSHSSRSPSKNQTRSRQQLQDASFTDKGVPYTGPLLAWHGTFIPWSSRRHGICAVVEATNSEQSN